MSESFIASNVVQCGESTAIYKYKLIIICIKTISRDIVEHICSNKILCNQISILNDKIYKNSTEKQRAEEY